MPIPALREQVAPYPCPRWMARVGCATRRACERRAAAAGWQVALAAVEFEAMDLRLDSRVVGCTCRPLEMLPRL